MAVALVILGLLVGISSAAFRSLEPPVQSITLRALQAARDSAVSTGRTLIWSEGESSVRFDPDGSSSGGTITVDGATYTIDRVSGAVRENR